MTKLLFVIFAKKKIMRLLSLLSIIVLFSCNEPPTPSATANLLVNGKLPILGEVKIENGDTIRHTIPEFSFTNQKGETVTNATFEGKAYVTDFFFTSCPTICPKVKKQMLRIFDQHKSNPNLKLVSYTIDPKRDNVEHLGNYARNLGVTTENWQFLTGDKWELHGIADDYFSIAIENDDAPGGFDHSGRLILVDENRHIRSFCDGTDPKSVDGFLNDIDLLMKEDYEK